MLKSKMLTLAFLVGSIALPSFISELAFLFLAVLAYIVYKYASLPK
jgi:hypothetical protein